MEHKRAGMSTWAHGAHATGAMPAEPAISLPDTNWHKGTQARALWLSAFPTEGGPGKHVQPL